MNDNPLPSLNMAATILASVELCLEESGCPLTPAQQVVWRDAQAVIGQQVVEVSA